MAKAGAATVPPRVAAPALSLKHLFPWGGAMKANPMSGTLLNTLQTRAEKGVMPLSANGRLIDLAHIAPVALIISAPLASGANFFSCRDLADNEVFRIPFRGLAFLSRNLSKSLPPSGPWRQGDHISNSPEF